MSRQAPSPMTITATASTTRSTNDSSEWCKKVGSCEAAEAPPWSDLRQPADADGEGIHGSGGADRHSAAAAGMRGVRDHALAAAGHRANSDSRGAATARARAPREYPAAARGDRLRHQRQESVA